jgi:hypothetical protein
MFGIAASEICYDYNAITIICYVTHSTVNPILKFLIYNCSVTNQYLI